MTHTAKSPSRRSCLSGLLGAFAAGLLVSAASSMPAAAQDQIVLKAAHLFPNDLYIWKRGPQVFADEVEKLSNGRVKFEIYPAGQLGKDTVSTLESGIADIALLVPSYNPDKLPLSSVAELPSLYATSCEGTDKLWKIAQPGGVLHEAEYEPKGIRLLMVNALPPYVILTTRKSPDTLQAIHGLKFRANGNSLKKTVSALGGVAVQIPTTELYDSLSRGTVDGTLSSYLAIPDYDLQKHLKYSVEGPRLGGGSIALGIKESVWDGLPDEVKTVLEEAGRVAQTSMCEWEDKNTADIRDSIVAKDGHTVVKLGEEEIRQWEAQVEGVTHSWMEEIKSAGKDGAAIFQAFEAR